MNETKKHYLAEEPLGKLLLKFSGALRAFHAGKRPVQHCGPDFYRPGGGVFGKRGHQCGIPLYGGGPGSGAAGRGRLRSALEPFPGKGEKESAHRCVGSGMMLCAAVGLCADGAGLSLSGRNPDTVRRDGVLPRLCGGIYDGNHPGDPLLCVRLRHEFRHPCRWVAGVFHVCHGVGGRAQFDSGSGGYLCAGDGGCGARLPPPSSARRPPVRPRFSISAGPNPFPAEGQLPALRPALPQNRPAGDFQLYHPDCHRGGDGGGKQHDCALRAALRLWGGYSPFLLWGLS